MEDDSIDQMKPMEDSSRSTTEPVKEENGEKVGLINQLISSITNTETEHKKQAEEGQQGKAGGGILENLISNLKSPRAGDSNLEGGDFFRDPEEEQTQRIEDRVDGKGGLVGTIVSNLPISIADNAGPDSDEASMLIHSVVHD